MQGVFRHVERNVDLVFKSLVKTSEQGTAAAQVDAILYNVGIEFGWRVLQCREYGIPIS